MGTVIGIASGSLECTVAEPWMVFQQRVLCVTGIASGSLEHSSFICSLVYCPYKPHNINVMIIFQTRVFQVMFSSSFLYLMEPRVMFLHMQMFMTLHGLPCGRYRVFLYCQGLHNTFFLFFGRIYPFWLPLILVNAFFDQHSRNMGAR